MIGGEDDTPLDPFRDILGLDLPAERLAQSLRAYRDVLQAIQKLRELDLTDQHPAVLFDPCAGRSDETDP